MNGRTATLSHSDDPTITKPRGRPRKYETLEDSAAMNRLSASTRSKAKTQLLYEQHRKIKELEELCATHVKSIEQLVTFISKNSMEIPGEVRDNIVLEGFHV